MSAVDVTKTIEDATVAELLQAAQERCEGYTNRANSPEVSVPKAAGEFVIARRHAEDAQMRFTRGLAIMRGVFSPVDLENVEALEERRRFLNEHAEATGG